MIIAIDGPAGSGKSTVARRVADELQLNVVDTGALYRAVALAARRAGIAVDDGARLAALVAGLDLRLERRGGLERLLLAGEDVSEAIRSPEIGQAASAYSARPEVRAGLLELQRCLAHRPPGAVLEGRDIGTVVCPDADHKFFLLADPQERARRRYAELLLRGSAPSYEEVLVATIARDRADEERATAPLRQAADALAIDSTRLDVEGVVQLIVTAVRRSDRLAPCGEQGTKGAKNL
ncbi:MAG: (d)CMP kinase [Deltaproteobacteria bacterium]|nr:(d)CMP kinase [Deltaproteobacteria bacterium]